MQLRKTHVYAKWINGLRDLQGRARILMRVERLADGHAGDVKPLGGGVWELRIHFGPGYRVYFTHQGQDIVILLAGGDKSSQSKDIQTALMLAKKPGAVNHGQDPHHPLRCRRPFAYP